jgi:hypothetical protein
MADAEPAVGLEAGDQPLTPVSAMEKTLTSRSEDWTPTGRRTVAQTLVSNKVSTRQVAEGKLTAEDLSELGIALGDKKRILESRSVSDRNYGRLTRAERDTWPAIAS